MRIRLIPAAAAAMLLATPAATALAAEDSFPKSPVDGVVKYDDAEGAGDVKDMDTTAGSAARDDATVKTVIGGDQTAETDTTGEKTDSFPNSPVDDVVQYDDAEGADAALKDTEERGDLRD